MLAKTKLNTTWILTSKASFNSDIRHNEVFLVNVLKELDDMKEAFKNPDNR